MKKITRYLILGIFVLGIVGYKLLTLLESTPENVVITGSCENMESESPVTMIKDQLMVMTIDSDSVKGVVRKTGEQVKCPASTVIKEFGKYRHLPLVLQTLVATPDEDLIPLVEFKVEDNAIKDLKSTNVLVSGTCVDNDTEMTLNQEPATVLDTERVKGRYQVDIFLYASSKKVRCQFNSIALSAASDYHIEKAKLKVMNPDQLLGRTVLLTGICRPEAANDPVYMNLINAKVKIIDVEIKDGRAVRLRAGVESKAKIVNCGETNGRFVLEPYISLSASNE